MTVRKARASASTRSTGDQALDQLSRFSAEVGALVDPVTLPKAALPLFAALTGATRGCLGLVEPARPTLRLAATIGCEAPPALELRASEIERLGNQAWRIPDARLPSCCAALLRAFGESLFLVPLFAHNRLLGLVVVERTTGDEGPSLELLSAAGRQLALALENAQLFADLEASYRKLMDAQAGLIRSERLAAIGELAATMAHEIRNPLATIFSAITQIRKHAGMQGDAATLLMIAEEEAVRLNRMVTGLLEFARPRVPNLSTGRPAEVFPEAVRAVLGHPDYHEGVEVGVVPGSDQVVAAFDQELLQRAVKHLASNALQALGPRAGRIDFAVRAETGPGGMVAVEVRDSGCGILPEVREKIFNPFFTTKPAGTGLGLPVVKRIAEDHGGAIEIVSEPGQGTLVRILLPVEPRS